MAKNDDVLLDSTSIIPSRLRIVYFLRVMLHDLWENNIALNRLFNR